ncbi:hypothetical protein EPN81_04885 [Patescibacteria group bacterium]|nr:MAG: hypothetical protein EPN81_04885 [Patescibacteria group bacterium]
MEAPRYIELKAREQVLEVVHTTLIPRLWKFVLGTLWTVLPFFFLFPLWRLRGWGVAIFFVWLLSGLILLSRQYLMWVRTVFLVTDMRVIDYDQRGFFHRVVTEARYEHMDEVSVQVKGIVPTIARYGTLKMQLQGSAADIQIEYVHRPEPLADLINDLRSQVRHDPHAIT